MERSGETAGIKWRGGEIRQVLSGEGGGRDGRY